MRSGEESKVSNLVWSVFTEFEAPEYSQAGIDEFKKFILPEQIKTNCDSGELFILCCKNNEEIVGIIAIRGCSHISLLFVKREYHRKGIARKLLKLAIEKCCKMDPDLKGITVNSSPYAIRIYEKMGFERTDGEQEINGIRFTPMNLTLSVQKIISG
jgi:GNAT superfamily N-acetyltransferase